MALSDDEGAEDANDVRTDAFHESFDADPTAAALREYDINAANTSEDEDGDLHEISSAEEDSEPTDTAGRRQWRRLAIVKRGAGGPGAAAPGLHCGRVVRLLLICASAHSPPHDAAIVVEVTL